MEQAAGIAEIKKEGPFHMHDVADEKASAEIVSWLEDTQ